MNGIEHIQQVFQQARRQGRPALMPYFTLGFPNPEVSLNIIEAIAGAGADLIELGLPFSDPLADGPTIQRSTQTALAEGMTLNRCLEMTACLRQRGVTQPLLLMGYYNPILNYGIERCVATAAQSGADGFIIPDLPPEEAGQMETACKSHGLALVFLVAPTSTPERLALVADHSRGFLYLVSLTGVTGERQELSVGLSEYIARVRKATSLPLAVGFGISTPEQAAQVGRLADGVIVGSALIRAALSEHPVEAVADLVRKLR